MTVEKEEIASRVVELLKEKGMRLASAESLTGGMVSEWITAVPGASEVLECGVCSYSNRIKHEVLGVSLHTLDTYTEYSAQTAEEMARGVMELAGADIGVSTTGIAGPGGGSEEKPVGLVYVGVSAKNYSKTLELHLFEEGRGIREEIRHLACTYALKAVIKALSEEIA